MERIVSAARPPGKLVPKRRRPVEPGESDLAKSDEPASRRDAPTVSVILPVLNEEAHLDRCLRAVDEQTYPSIIEVVVADGGSTDETRSDGFQVREGTRSRQREAHPAQRA